MTSERDVDAHGRCELLASDAAEFSRVRISVQVDEIQAAASVVRQSATTTPWAGVLEKTVYIFIFLNCCLFHPSP